MAGKILLATTAFCLSLAFSGCASSAKDASVQVEASADAKKYESYKRPDNPDGEASVDHAQFTAQPFAVGDVSRFVFADWPGPDIPVWTYVPSGVDLSNVPIVFVMHGASRNPARYLLDWAPFAQERGFVVIAPEFGRRHFAGAERYNRGNVIAIAEDGSFTDNAREDWTFAAIEPVFDHTVQALGSSRKTYTLYGHSAGAQFIHRFMFHVPQARVSRFLAANAGWYTMPDFEQRYPYGLRDGGISRTAMQEALQKDVIILLGDQDIDEQHRSLRRTPEAMLQGPHRYARGFEFVRIAEETATDLNVPLRWRVESVPGVAHRNRGMAAAAAKHVE